MIIRRMRIAVWIPKATNIRSEYGIFIAFPLQQWLHERASLLRRTTLSVLLIFIVSRSLTSPVKNREGACDCYLSLSQCLQKAALRIVILMTTLGRCSCHIVAVIFSHLFLA